MAFFMIRYQRYCPFLQADANCVPESCGLQELATEMSAAQAGLTVRCFAAHGAWPLVIKTKNS